MKAGFLLEVTQDSSLIIKNKRTKQDMCFDGTNKKICQLFQVAYGLGTKLKACVKVCIDAISRPTYFNNFFFKQSYKLL